jgi:hypothetical protein
VVVVAVVSLAVVLVAVVLVVSAQTFLGSLLEVEQPLKQHYRRLLQLITQSQSVLVVQETQETQGLKAQMEVTLY